MTYTTQKYAPLFILAVIVGVTALGVTGCQTAESPASASASAVVGPAPTAVRVLEVVSEPFVATTTLTGQTRADATVVLSSEASGRIVTLEAVKGQDVKVGAVLAQIDARTDYTRVSQLKANRGARQDDLDRAKQLFEQGVGTRQAFDAASINLKNAKYDLRMAQQGASKSVTRAPIAGVIEMVHVDKGEYVNPGAPLVTVVDYETIVVEVGVPERYVHNVAVGQSMDVTLAATGRKMAGEVTHIAVVADGGSRTFGLEIAIDNAARQVRPGMQVKVDLPTAKLEQAVKVPRGALLRTRDGAEAYVVGEGEVATRRAVELGPTFGDSAVVTKGLEPGDKLIVLGQHLLREGSPVHIAP